jgi:hypothetical protein
LCRAGADAVYAAEISQHMCDVGEEATIMNGFLGRINMLDRWGCGGCSVHMAVYGVGFGCTPF